MPNDKDKAIYFLKCLIELVENDRVRVEDIQGKTAAEVIELAEAEAQKAATDSADLRDGR
jgi:hypothetical protein